MKFWILIILYTICMIGALFDILKNESRMIVVWALISLGIAFQIAYYLKVQ